MIALYDEARAIDAAARRKRRLEFIDIVQSCQRKEKERRLGETNDTVKRTLRLFVYGSMRIELRAT